MILVTHEIEFARRIADRVAFMERGALIAHQDADTFFNHQDDERIARFVDKMKH